MDLQFDSYQSVKKASERMNAHESIMGSGEWFEENWKRKLLDVVPSVTRCCATITTAI